MATGTANIAEAQIGALNMLKQAKQSIDNKRDKNKDKESKGGEEASNNFQATSSEGRSSYQAVTVVEEASETPKKADNRPTFFEPAQKVTAPYKEVAQPFKDKIAARDFENLCMDYDITTLEEYLRSEEDKADYAKLKAEYEAYFDEELEIKNPDFASATNKLLQKAKTAKGDKSRYDYIKHGIWRYNDEFDNLKNSGKTALLENVYNTYRAYIKTMGGYSLLHHFNCAPDGKGIYFEGNSARGITSKGGSIINEATGATLGSAKADGSVYSGGALVCKISADGTITRNGATVGKIDDQGYVYTGTQGKYRKVALCAMERTGVVKINDKNVGSFSHKEINMPYGRKINTNDFQFNIHPAHASFIVFLYEIF